MSYLDRDPFVIYRDRDDNRPGPRLMGAGTLMSEVVCNRQDEDLGDVKEIMLDMQTGQIAYAVVPWRYSWDGQYTVRSSLASFAVRCSQQTLHPRLYKRKAGERSGFG